MNFDFIDTVKSEAIMINHSFCIPIRSIPMANLVYCMKFSLFRILFHVCYLEAAHLESFQFEIIPEIIILGSPNHPPDY